MFDNIGSKIKTVASTLTVIGIVLSIISGLIVLLDGEISGLFMMIFGSLLSWLGSFLLYGFGQLVENSDKILRCLEGHPSEGQPQSPPCQTVYAVPVSTAPDWQCASCGQLNRGHVAYCQNCGVTKHWSDAKHTETSDTIPF